MKRGENRENKRDEKSHAEGTEVGRWKVAMRWKNEVKKRIVGGGRKDKMNNVTVP